MDASGACVAEVINALAFYLTFQVLGDLVPVCVGVWWLVCMSGPLVSHTLMVFYVVFLAPLFEIP